jgi:hypothetical protein
MQTNLTRADYNYPAHLQKLQKQFNYFKAILNNFFNEVVMNIDDDDVKYFEDLISTCNNFINDYELLLKGRRI